MLVNRHYGSITTSGATTEFGPSSQTHFNQDRIVADRRLSVTSESFADTGDFRKLSTASSLEGNEPEARQFEYNMEIGPY